MRLLVPTLALIVAMAAAGCSGHSGSNSSSNQDSQDSATSSASADPSASTSAGADSIPNYPGATAEASGSTAGMGGTAASGKVLSTTDPFDKVYAWYQKNMPAGSEKTRTTSPIQSAVFMLGETGKDQRSVTITTQGDKTMISIAEVSQ